MDIRTISGNGECYENVEIVDFDDLPRGCYNIAWILNEDDFEYYTIYKDTVTKLLYGVAEGEEDQE